jgi:phosphoglycerol transferase
VQAGTTPSSAEAAQETDAAPHVAAARTRRRPPAELLWVLATALVATIVAVIDLKLWKMDAHVPIFDPSGDGNYYLATIKDVVEHGWFWHNPDLGAPVGQANYDFPAPFGDLAHYLIVSVLALVLNDHVLVFNAFFLLCFPLIAVVAHVVMRDLGADRLPALVCGVLFAFLPYHLLRNEAHLFLTSYYAIPLGVWLAMTIAEGRTLIDRSARRATLLVVAVCLVAGAASNYYAIFTLCVLVFVVPVAALAHRSWRVALQGAAVMALVGASFLLCHSPAIVYPMTHGANEAVAQRTAGESEVFGLKLAYMVIPRPEHRIDFLARRGQRYFATTPLRSEGFNSSIGLAATLGLAAALAALLATGIAGAASLLRRRIAAAGAVALVAFVVGTVGGVSTLIALELSPEVRAWNRLSLVVAFAGLLALALALTALADRLRLRGRPAWVAMVAAAAVGLLGLLDQTTPSDAPAYPAIAAAWKVDDDFAQQMQDRFPAGTQVLQLPYMAYPENGTLIRVGDYDLFKGYLHTHGLRWTYGAIHGRPADWLAQHADLPVQQLAVAAAAAGFGAVYVDRGGYADGGAAVTSALGTVAGPGRSGRSADDRLQFFDLRPAAARLAGTITPAERAAVSAALLHPVVLDFGDGVSYQEMEGPTPYRWAAADARMTFDDPLAGTRTVTFTAHLFGGGATPSTVTFTLPDGSRHVETVDAAGKLVSFPLRLRQGRSTLRMQTSGPAAPHPPDNDRDLRLRIQEHSLTYAALAADRLARYVAAATP